MTHIFCRKIMATPSSTAASPGVKLCFIPYALELEMALPGLVVQSMDQSQHLEWAGGKREAGRSRRAESTSGTDIRRRCRPLRDPGSGNHKDILESC